MFEYTPVRSNFSIVPLSSFPFHKVETFADTLANTEIRGTCCSGSTSTVWAYLVQRRLTTCYSPPSSSLPGFPLSVWVWWSIHLGRHAFS